MRSFHVPGFSAWLAHYGLSLDDAAYVFGVSRRTVSRWRASEQISVSAAQILRTIERGTPLWNASFRRSTYYGLISLTYEWRQDYARHQGAERWQELL